MKLAQVWQFADEELMSLYDFQKHRVFGIVLGLVTNNQDPDNLGRVKVKYHMLDQNVESDWCRVVTLYAGLQRGTFYLPEVDDEVVLGFEYGDVNFPFVLGSVYNGKDIPPVSKSELKDNDTKRFHSRSGHQFTFSDKKGEEKISLIDCKGKNSIEIDVKSDKITIQASTGNMDILVPKGTLTIKCKDLKVESSKTTSFKAGDTFGIKAAKDISMKTDAAMSATASKDISVKSSSAAIKLTASTSMVSKSTDFTIQGSNGGQVKAASKLTLKGGKVFIN